MTEPEIELREKILQKLMQIKETSERYGAKALTEDFANGFIFGAETAKGIRLTPDMREEILQKIIGG